MNLSPNKTIYIARDIERALSIEPSEDYLIVTNDDKYARSIKEKYPDFVLLIESPVSLDTFELLEKEETEKFIREKTGNEQLGNDQNKGKEQKAKSKDEEKKEIDNDKPNILVFKNTARIEEFCVKKSWRLLNPPAALAEKIENKISQVDWLGPLAQLLPSFKITTAKEILWEKKPFILQWAHAHTGIGTILVNSEKELKEIQNKFPDRPVKASEYIKGPTFTVNVAVKGKSASRKSKVESKEEALARNTSSAATQDERDANASVVVDGAVKEHGYDVNVGNVSYQITGMPPLTDSPFATVGNDWSLPHTILNERHLDELHNIAEKIGAKMRDSGWKGLFGIDVIFDEKRDQLKLIEINARQPASTTYESQLQSKFRGHLPSEALAKEGGFVGSTIFEAHLAALLDLTLTETQVEINDGAQIVQRVTKTLSKIRSWTEKIAALNAAGYNTISYSNTKPNSDFLRIQSAKGLMEKDGKFNKIGIEIVEILEK